MSLAIDIDKITGVLLGGEWIQVLDGSFDIDAYEFINGETGIPVMYGAELPGVSSTGFSFIDEMGRKVCGPITAILAVRT